MAAGYCYSLGIKSNDFFLKDNKKAFILWLNVPKVTAYIYSYFYGICCERLVVHYAFYMVLFWLCINGIRHSWRIYWKNILRQKSDQDII